MLGDSLTAGLGLLETQAFPALLQEKLDADGYECEVVNAGVSGDTSAGGLRRLDWALDRGTCGSSSSRSAPTTAFAASRSPR